MRFAIVHCRSCLRHIWIPEGKLGLRGKCPDCGAPVEAPADWPESELAEGPHIAQDFGGSEPAPAGDRSRAAAVVVGLW
jgi:hypothetical protein